MKWTWETILQMLLAGGLFTALAGFFAKQMDWIRFRKKDSVEVGKVEAETELIRANAAEKVSDTALQLLSNVAVQLDKANMVIDKKEKENERLHEIIVTLKDDFERDFQKLRDDFNKRINELEQELEKSRQELERERIEYQKEIEKFKKFRDGN